MFKPSPMKLLSVVVRKEKANDAALRFVRSGVLHPVDAREIESGMEKLASGIPDREQAAWAELDARYCAVKKNLGMEIKEEEPEVRLTRANIEILLDDIEILLDPVVSRKNKLQEELGQKNALLEKNLPFLALGEARAKNMKFTSIRSGRIPAQDLPLIEKKLKDVPHAIIPVDERKSIIAALVVSLKSDSAAVETALAGTGWEETRIGEEFSPVPAETLEKEARDIKAKIEALDRKIEETAWKNREDLATAGYMIAVQRGAREAGRQTLATKSTVIFTGWVPEEETGRISAEARYADDSAFVDEKKAGETGVPMENVPVKMRHSALLRPFEILVGTYGIPRYNSVDPTAFVAISFLLMFGVMFGDIGHGLVLLILGILMGRAPRGAMKQASGLMAGIGLSSCVFGALYGSFFGVEFHGIWIKPMENIMAMFRACIIFGICLLTFGIFLGIANSISDKDYRKAIFGNAGLFAGLAYWSGIGVVSFFLSRTGSVPVIFTAVLVLSLAVIFLAPAVTAAIQRRSVPMAMAESGIHVLDIAMGYLANTVSFIRMAAFAMNHAGFFVAIFEISRMLEKTGSILPWTATVSGNVFVILLEGLVVMIQSLRLNYYEFFSKFFASGKQEYKPLKLEIG